MPRPQTFEFRGCRLAYRVSGVGPPLIMIQGVGAFGATGANPLVEILDRFYTCLTFDNRGIGLSQPQGGRLSVDRMADDTLALIDHLDWSSAHVVGHSLGGLIGLQTALNAKSRIRSLSLVCSFARGADAARLSLGLFWIALRLRFGPRSARRQAFMEMVLSPGHGKAESERLAERLSEVFGHDIGDLPEIIWQQAAAMREHDVTPRLRELSGIPTLVINGTEDTIARPASGRAIAAGIVGAKFIEIPKASHAFPVFEAEQCAGLLLQHLAEAERRIVPTPGSCATGSGTTGI